MKNINIYGLFLFAAIAFAACTKDNYEQPHSKFTGRITYQGKPLNVQQGAISFELYEPGFAKKLPIAVNVDQEGNFSSEIFDADYKLLIPKNRGPFISLTNQVTNSDTIPIKLKGTLNMDIEVRPYYMLRNEQFTAAAGRKITTTFAIDRVITEPALAKAIERVTLYVGKTQFVDGNRQIAGSAKDLAGSAITDLNNVTITTTVPVLPIVQSYVFVRAGLKISGLNDMIYTPVKRLDLVP